jgi:hypothetical protein
LITPRITETLLRDRGERQVFELIVELYFMIAEELEKPR